MYTAQQPSSSYVKKLTSLYSSLKRVAWCYSDPMNMDMHIPDLDTCSSYVCCSEHNAVDSSPEQKEFRGLNMCCPPAWQAGLSVGGGNGRKAEGDMNDGGKPGEAR
jgi:hypothetical protein